MDAKARGVAYVDKEEEEWEAFQKEIEAEASVAQNILVEDRTEATVDRQIEEIDEQIEAWQRYMEVLFKLKTTQVINILSMAFFSFQGQSVRKDERPGRVQVETG